MKQLLFVAMLACLAISLTASAAVEIKFWENTSTSTLADAYGVVTGGTEPTRVETADELQWMDQGIDNYVGGIQGWLTVPESGEYTFYIAGDDHCGLYIGGNTPICEVQGWSGNADFSKYASQTSAPITLRAGDLYAFTVAQREGGGGDGCNVAWTGPGMETITTISGDYVSLIGPPIIEIAPLDRADHVTDVTLSWAYPDAPEGTLYMVSFGADPATWLTLPNPGTELPLGSVGGGLADFDTTYYWQVTAGDAKSNLFSFHTEHNRPQFNRLEGAVQPQSLAGKVGAPAELSCTAVSYTPSDITYQWYKVMDGNGVAIEGATDPVLGVAELALDNDGQYYCIATNDAGATTSDTVMVDVQVGLIHRYTFNDGDVAEIDGQLVALDVVGGADGTIINKTGAAVVANGLLTFGNDGSQFSNGDGGIGNGDYVDLPNGIISSLGAVTLEAWVTWDDEAKGFWSRVYSFGMSAAGEDMSNNGTSFLMLTVNANANGGDLAAAFAAPTEIRLYPHKHGPAPLHQEILITVVHDDLVGLDKLYVNGIAQGVKETNITLSQLDDRNNWLGRAQWGDPLLVGSFNEFRMHDTALTSEEILANYLAGPDELGVVETNPCDENMVGDVNGDCVIDLADAAVMIENFLLDELFAVE